MAYFVCVCVCVCVCVGFFFFFHFLESGEYNEYSLETQEKVTELKNSVLTTT